MSRDAGMVLLSNRANAILHAAGGLALFRNIIIEVTEQVRMQHEVWWQEFQEPQKRVTKALKKSRQYGDRVAWLDLQWAKEGLTNIVNEGSQHPRKINVLNRFPQGFDHQDVDTAMDALDRVTQDVASRPDFKGFSLDDLRTMVAALKIG